MSAKNDMESGKPKFEELKLDKWENYLQFIKNPKSYEGVSQAISIGADESLISAEYVNLFEYLPEYEELIKKYPIPELENKKTVFAKSLAVMNWLTRSTYYSGMQREPLPDDSLKILNFAFNKDFEFAINCRDKAIALTDLLIARGIMAYPICLEDENHYGRHFVVHVFCSDENKWIVLDPSFNCYFKNKSKSVLNIFELRNLRLKNELPDVIDYSFNGTNECMDIYLQYFVGATLTNITTWESNSNDGRKEFERRKKFNAKLPDLESAKDMFLRGLNNALEK